MYSSVYFMYILHIFNGLVYIPKAAGALINNVRATLPQCKKNTRTEMKVE